MSEKQGFEIESQLEAKDQSTKTEFVTSRTVMKDKTSLIVTPLGDIDDALSSGKMGTKRRNSDDSLFEIVPQLLIRTCPIIDDVGDRGDGVQFSKQTTPKRIHSAAGGGDTIGVVLDSELLILEKDYDYEKARRVTFESPIDFILWRRSIILIGLSSSEVVLIDPNTYTIKESKKLSAGSLPCTGTDKFFINAAIHSNPDPTKIDLIAVDYTGVVYLFNNISLSDGILDSTQDQNVSVDIDLGSIRGTKIKCLEKENTKVLCAASPTRNILILGEENGTLSIHDLEDTLNSNKEINFSREINIIDDLGLHNTWIKKMVDFEGVLFVLLSNGGLEILLDDVLFATYPLKLPQDSLVVHDFALVITGESEVKLWVIYGDADNTSENKNYIGIFAGPSFKLEFSVKIPFFKVDEIQEKTVTRFMFPSQVTPFEEPFAFLEVSAFGTKVYRMLETSTEATILKLLARGKFDQAISLSVTYKKDLDIVYKALARAKFNEIMGCKDSKASNILTAFETMIETLKKIRDATFVCCFCCQQGVPNISWIKTLLGVGKAFVKDCSGTQAGKNLLLNIKKFYTFEQVYHNPTLEEWIAFASVENTMFQQCTWFLNKHEFEKCERVWKRHFDEFIPDIDLNDFAPFFFVLFGHKLHSPEAISLFKCILPYAVEKCAGSGGINTASPSERVTIALLNETQISRVGILVEFAKRQVCSLERERGWPSEAITFSKIVISVVSEVIQTLEYSHNKLEGSIVTQQLICNEIRQKMELLVQNLIELSDLKQHHSIRIPFQEYTDNDVIEVVNSMLYELFLRDEIERFIRKFLIPFAQRKMIEVDELFFEHIKTVVSDLPFHINPLDIPHEERLITLIMFISCHETKLRSVLKIAAEWPVPWSPNIDNLVEECLRMNVQGDKICKDLQKTINIMRIQVPFRCILTKYRLTTSTSKVQNHSWVVMALTRIIKAGKPEYLEDCQELIKHTGKTNEGKIESNEFSWKLRDINVPMEQLVSPKLDRALLKRLLARTLQELRMCDLHLLREEEIKRVVKVSKFIANTLDDRKVIEFLKLRKAIPSLQNCDIVYEKDYPFCVLKSTMREFSEEPCDKIISLCKNIANITFIHFNDILVAAASFYIARFCGSGTDLLKTWNIVEEIVKTPCDHSWGRSYYNSMAAQFVQTTATTITQFLMCHIPQASDHQLGILHDFIVILTSFDDLTEDMSKLLSSFKVFWGLREQEIPQENEFLQIYNWMYFEGVQEDRFLEHTKLFGSTILKYGDKDLFKQAFGCIQKELLSRMFGKAEKLALTPLTKRINDLQKELYGSLHSFAEPETDKSVLELVKSLKREAGISVTPYALRQRNKGRFLEKLLGINQFSLAAQVAIIFEVFTDYNAWSKILQGFIDSSDNINELRKVLLDLRNISELWMLPEFSNGWKKVSEIDAGFLDLCPVPLD